MEQTGGALWKIDKRKSELLQLASGAKSLGSMKNLLQFMRPALQPLI